MQSKQEGRNTNMNNRNGSLLKNLMKTLTIQQITLIRRLTKTKKNFQTDRTNKCISTLKHQ